MFWFASRRVEKYITILEKQLNIQDNAIARKDIEYNDLETTYNLQVMINKELIAINESIINKIKDSENAEPNNTTD